MNPEQSLPVLDDLERVQSVDKRNMLRLINELPEQCETALGIGRSFSVEPLETKPNVVFITGVGDSGIGADMAVAAIAGEIDVPVVSDHDGRIPAYVGEESLVFVVDYTGKNALAIHSYREAKQRGANVICLTTSGKLNEAAVADGSKVIRIPAGQPARSAIGYIFLPLVTVIERMGLVAGPTEKASYAIRLMKNVRESFRFDNPTTRNIAKQTALALFEKMPIIYGVSGYRSIVAERWKSQINANSKCPAFAGLFPDFVEGQISAWEATDRPEGNATFVFLEDAQDKNTEIRDQMAAGRELLERFGVLEIEMKGNSVAEKMLYGLYMGDYVSYYLALLYEVNPMVTEYVAHVALRMEAEEEPPAE